MALDVEFVDPNSIPKRRDYAAMFKQMLKPDENGKLPGAKINVKTAREAQLVQRALYLAAKRLDLNGLAVKTRRADKAVFVWFERDGAEP